MDALFGGDAEHATPTEPRRPTVDHGGPARRAPPGHLQAGGSGLPSHGYRGTTIKALAHACHLSPAGLYHYFASKADLATYVVRQPHLEWRTVHVDPAVDPLVQLRGMIDLAIRELPDFLLALDMAEELEVPGMAGLRRGLFAEGEAIFGRYIAAVRPSMAPQAARDLARLVLAVLIGSYEIGDGFPTTVATTRERIIRVLRAELVPVAVESARFDRTMAGT